MDSGRDGRYELTDIEIEDIYDDVDNDALAIKATAVIDYDYLSQKDQDDYEDAMERQHDARMEDDPEYRRRYQR